MKSGTTDDQVIMTAREIEAITELFSAYAGLFQAMRSMPQTAAVPEIFTLPEFKAVEKASVKAISVIFAASMADFLLDDAKAAA